MARILASYPPSLSGPTLSRAHRRPDSICMNIGTVNQSHFFTPLRGLQSRWTVTNVGEWRRFQNPYAMLAGMEGVYLLWRQLREFLIDI